MWRQCFIPMMETGEPADHRWCMDDGKLDNQWMTCNPSLDAVHIIKQKICIYTYAFLSLNHHIKFILVFYHLCRFQNSYLATANVPVVKTYICVKNALAFTDVYLCKTCDNSNAQEDEASEADESNENDDDSE